MNGRFIASLAFALVASLAVVPWLLVMAPYFGLPAALAAFCAPALGAYLFVIAPRPSHGLKAGLLALLAYAVPWLLAADSRSQLLAAALILAVVRSGFLYRRRPARAIVLEAALGVGGLGLAGLLAGGSVLSWALAAWGYLLAQSLFFLVADTEARKAETAGDAFDSALDKALAVLENRA